MNIVLIGMMGCGKSVVGKNLSENLSYNFIDTDNLIENKYGKISEIFSNKGEKYFRKLETKIIKSISKTDKTIISTGGGIVLNEKNILYLKRNATIFYLKAKPETLFMRTKGSERPLLQTGGLEKINEILEKRTSLYEKYSNFTITTDDRKILEIVEEIRLKIME